MNRKYRIVSVEKFKEEILEIAKSGLYEVYISKRMLHKLIDGPAIFNIHFMRSNHRIYNDRPEFDGLYLDSHSLGIQRIIHDTEFGVPSIIYEFPLSRNRSILYGNKIFYI